MTVPPSYYRYAIDEDAIYEYFTKVADASPLPIILYNYPGAVAGIDMDSDLIIKLANDVARVVNDDPTELTALYWSEATLRDSFSKARLVDFQIRPYYASKGALAHAPIEFWEFYLATPHTAICTAVKAL